MPKSFDPDNTFEVWLDSDEHIPLHDRPVCIARPVTVRKFNEIASKYREAIKAQAEAEFEHATELVVECFMQSCVGWRNMRQELTRDAVIDTLSVGELMELFLKMRDEQQVSPDEAGKSESPQPFVTGKSAADAATASNVPLAQVQPNLSSSTVLSAGTGQGRQTADTVTAEAT